MLSANTFRVCRSEAKEQGIVLSLEGMKSQYVDREVTLSWVSQDEEECTSSQSGRDIVIRGNSVPETTEIFAGSLHLGTWNSLELVERRAQNGHTGDKTAEGDT